MNSRERFLKVINGEIPDRVPVTLFIIEQGHFINYIYPELKPEDYIEGQLKVIEIQKELGCDVFVRLLYGSTPLWVMYGGVNTDRETENWEIHCEEYERGNTKVKKYKIRTPEGEIYQEFSTFYKGNGTYFYNCTVHPVKNEKDLDIIIKYEPKMDPQYPAKIKEHVSIIKKALGNDGIIGIWSPHGPYNNSASLIDLNTLYSLFLYDYPFYEKIMNFSIDRFVDYVNAISDSGVDVHCIGANVAGGFIGKKLFDQYILPFEKKYMDIVQSKGIPALYHNCGEIMNYVESYIEVGPKLVEPFSPYPLGDGDLAEAKRRSQGKYVIFGNVDQVNLLLPGPIERIKKVTKKTVEIGKQGGKFVLQSADFIEYGTPIENLKAYVETGIEYGGY